MGFWKSGLEGLDSIQKGWHYDNLSPVQQEAYHAVVEGIVSFQKKVQAKGISNKEEMERVISAVIWEQPQLFYFNCNEMSVVNMGSHYVFSVEYIYDKKKSAQMMQQIEESAAFILSQTIVEGMDDYQKCLAIHDYMTENIRYNFSALSVNYAYDAFTLEGAILKKQAVCEGVAKGISYLLNKLGISNMIVNGTSDINGQRIGHAWNMVELEGEYYHIDATWDLQEINHFTNHSHMYFNLDDESMINNHYWELEDYPTCDSNQENYYVKEKRYFRTMRSFELYVQKFLKEGQGYMDVRFEDTLELPENGGEHIAGIVQKNAPYAGKMVRLSYVFNPHNYVFQADFSYLG